MQKLWCGAGGGRRGQQTAGFVSSGVTIHNTFILHNGGKVYVMFIMRLRRVGKVSALSIRGQEIITCNSLFESK